MRPLSALETCLYVDDLERAEEFYSRVLGFTLVGRQPARHLFFRCGDSMLLLFLAAATSQPPSELPLHGARGAQHVAFAVAQRDLPEWRRRLEARQVTIELEHTWPRGGKSLYFRDPAGNSLELTSPTIWGLPEAEG